MPPSRPDADNAPIAVEGLRPQLGASGWRRLRCAHYISPVRLSKGGPVRVVLDLGATLAARGHRVTLLTSDAADVPAGWNAADSRTPTVITLEEPGRFTKLLPRSALDRAARVLEECDVLHLHGAWEPPNLQFARLARRIKLPYVVTVHGMLDDWCMRQQSVKKRTFLSLFGRRLFEGAAAVQCTARAEAEQASKHLGKATTVVLPNLVDLSPFDTLPGPGLAHAAFPDSRTDLPKVLFLSRLHPKKGVELLIAAAALLRGRGRPLRVLVAGSGDPHYEQSLRDLVRRQKLEDVVKFLGLVRGAEKVSLYQAADVFVLPTSQENFGLVLAEAMACLTPVVTTKGVDIWREVQGAGGVIVEPTPAALAAAITELLANQSRRREAGEIGRRWVYQTLGPDQLLQRYEDLYFAAAAGRTASTQPRTA
jgi:glycosyltransferase involved in cell wall biosynthesis